jgi:hypothetical protein
LNLVCCGEELVTTLAVAWLIIIPVHYSALKYKESLQFYHISLPHEQAQSRFLTHLPDTVLELLLCIWAITGFEASHPERVVMIHESPQVNSEIVHEHAL